MSDLLVDVTFEESIVNIKSSLECIIKDDICGVKTLNASRKILGEYYPDMFIGLTLDMKAQEMIFESIFKLILNDHVMVLIPNTDVSPVPNRSGVRLVGLINSNRSSTIILMDPVLRSLICSDFPMVTRSAFRSIVNTPFEFNEAKRALEKALIKILVLLHGAWKDVSSQFNDPIYQRKDPKILSNMRTSMMNLYVKYSKLILEKYANDEEVKSMIPPHFENDDHDDHDEDADSMMDRIRSSNISRSVQGVSLRDSLSPPHANFIHSIDDE